MKRSELEHVLRAAAAVTGEKDFVVLGSQSILGRWPDASLTLRASMEIDLYPMHAPAKAALMDGALGELSPFHQTHGYYARGVGPETATLPAGWEKRLVAVCNENTHGATGHCLDPLDLAYSKLAAGRPKDMEFVARMMKFRLFSPTRFGAMLREVKTLKLPTGETMIDRYLSARALRRAYSRRLGL